MSFTFKFICKWVSHLKINLNSTMSNFYGMLCYVYVNNNLIPEVTILRVASISIQYSVTRAKGLIPIIQKTITLFSPWGLANSWTKFNQSTNDFTSYKHNGKNWKYLNLLTINQSLFNSLASVSVSVILIFLGQVQGLWVSAARQEQ